MDDKIKLLEERVAEAVDRLGKLATERTRLESELRSLREQLQNAQPEGAAVADSEREDWRSRRAQALEAIREVIADLRG